MKQVYYPQCGLSQISRGVPNVTFRYYCSGMFLQTGNMLTIYCQFVICLSTGQHANRFAATTMSNTVVQLRRKKRFHTDS